MNATVSLLADTICRTVELGVTITDAAVAGEFTHLFCSPVAADPVCIDCGTAGRLRDHVEPPAIPADTDTALTANPATELATHWPSGTASSNQGHTRWNPWVHPLMFSSETP